MTLLAINVAYLTCEGGTYEPMGSIALAAVSFLLSASILWRISDPPQQGRVTWIAMKVLAMIRNTVFLLAFLVGLWLMELKDLPVWIVLAGVLLVLSILALTPRLRRNIRPSMARRGNWSSLALLLAHVLVAGSILTASGMLALELSGGPAALNERTGCAMELSRSGG